MPSRDPLPESIPCPSPSPFSMLNISYKIYDYICKRVLLIVSSVIMYERNVNVIHDGALLPPLLRSHAAVSPLLSVKLIYKIRAYIDSRRTRKRRCWRDARLGFLRARRRVRCVFMSARVDQDATGNSIYLTIGSENLSRISIWYPRLLTRYTLVIQAEVKPRHHMQGAHTCNASWTNVV